MATTIVIKLLLFIVRLLIFQPLMDGSLKYRTLMNTEYYKLLEESEKEMNEIADGG